VREPAPAEHAPCGRATAAGARALGGRPGGRPGAPRVRAPWRCRRTTDRPVLGGRLPGI